MTRINAHGLRFQSLLVLKLFVICIVASIYLNYQRDWVEGFMRETYSSTPQSLQPIVDAIRMDKAIRELYTEVPFEDRVLLYDFWVTSEPSPKQLPQQLLSVDFDLFSKRVERTLVSGSAEQRKKALLFCEFGSEPGMVPILEKVLAWSERRKLEDFADQINQTIASLKQR